MHRPLSGVTTLVCEWPLDWIKKMRGFYESAGLNEAPDQTMRRSLAGRAVSGSHESGLCRHRSPYMATRGWRDAVRHPARHPDGHPDGEGADTPSGWRVEVHRAIRIRMAIRESEICLILFGHRKFHPFIRHTSNIHVGHPCIPPG